MLDKLKNISKRYDAINEKLSDPAIFSDKQEFAALMRERKGLEPVVEKYGEPRSTKWTRRKSCFLPTPTKN